MECCFENPLPNTVCRNNYQTTIYHDHEPQLFLVLKGQLPPQNRYRQESLHRPGDRWPRRRPHHIQAACACIGHAMENMLKKHIGNMVLDAQTMAYWYSVTITNPNHAVYPKFVSTVLCTRQWPEALANWFAASEELDHTQSLKRNVRLSGVQVFLNKKSLSWNALHFQHGTSCSQVLLLFKNSFLYWDLLPGNLQPSNSIWNSHASSNEIQ